MKVITARPFINFKILSNFRSKVLHSDLIYFKSGRDALLFGLELINIHPKSSIIIPAYICNSITFTLKNAGYNLIFIDVDKDLNIPLKQLEKLTKINDIKALLIVNYFGFLSNITELTDYCKRKNIIVIEDCAHSFLSKYNGINFGSFGDISIFSKRKILPIHDGGALKINVPNSHRVYSQKKSSFLNSFTYLLNRFIELIIITIRWPNIYSQRIDNFKFFISGFLNKEINQPYSSNSIVSREPSFFLQKYISSNKYINQVSVNRRNNFNTIISGAIKLGYTPLYSDLNKGIVPQHAIIYDHHGGLVEFLRHNSIGASRWPWYDLAPEIKSSKANFPNTIYFDKSLVMIPIHQSLNQLDCQLILKNLKLWKNLKSNSI
jgi:hypothetical protein